MRMVQVLHNNLGEVDQKGDLQDTEHQSQTGTHTNNYRSHFEGQQVLGRKRTCGETLQIG